jgi:hypothetical protein
MFKKLFAKKPAAVVAPVVDETRMDITDEKIAAVITALETNGITVPIPSNFAFALTFQNSYWGGSMEYTERDFGYRIISENILGTRTIRRIYVINYNNRYSAEELTRVNTAVAAALSN